MSIKKNYVYLNSEYAKKSIFPYCNNDERLRSQKNKKDLSNYEMLNQI